MVEKMLLILYVICSEKLTKYYAEWSVFRQSSYVKNVSKIHSSGGSSFSHTQISHFSMYYPEFYDLVWKDSANEIDSIKLRNWLI